MGGIAQELQWYLKQELWPQVKNNVAASSLKAILDLSFISTEHLPLYHLERFSLCRHYESMYILPPPPPRLFLVVEHSFWCTKSSCCSPMGVLLAYRRRNKQIMSSFHQGQNFTLNFYDLAFGYLLSMFTLSLLYCLSIFSFLLPISHTITLSYHSIKCRNVYVIS